MIENQFIGVGIQNSVAVENEGLAPLQQLLDLVPARWHTGSAYHLAVEVCVHAGLGICILCDS